MTAGRALGALLVLVSVTGPVGAQPVAVPIQVAWAALGVELRLSEDHFEVRGRTLREVRGALDRDGPLAADGTRRHAVTVYSLSSRWTVDRGPGACRVTGATVVADILVLLPSWRGVEKATDLDYARWRVLEDQLTAHEHAHRDLALAAARRLAERFRHLEAPTCPALDHRIGALTARIRDELDHAHADLDRAHAPARPR